MTDATFYIDCEFDGHDGPLLSIAMVREDGANAYVTTGAVAEDPWVIENVLPLLGSHNAHNTWHVRPREVGTVLRNFMWPCDRPTIIADSPVDIGRFCQAISTGEDGAWASTETERIPQNEQHRFRLHGYTAIGRPAGPGGVRCDEREPGEVLA